MKLAHEVQDLAPQGFLVAHGKRAATVHQTAQRKPGPGGGGGVERANLAAW